MERLPLTFDATELAAHSAAIVALIISLTARRDACFDFCMNQGLQIEAKLLTAQIEALNRELDHLATNLCSTHPRP